MVIIMKKIFMAFTAFVASAAVFAAPVPVSASRSSDSDYSDFIRGVDVSMLKTVEDCGGLFYDNAVPQDALEILKNHGANAVRLRLWVDPYDANGDSYGGGGNDYATTLGLAQRAKQLGMKVLIDFHLSDWWADPGTQSKPKAWENLTYADLKTALYDYVKDTMDDLVSDGMIPDMVQIGNETSSGILWEDGYVGNGVNSFSNLADLVSTAIDGVRDSVGNQTKVILHLDNGGNNSLYRWWFDGITGTNHEVDFDMIGLTYYPMWHGTLEDLQYNMNDISQRYGKDVIVVETAYGWTTDDGDGLGSSFSPQDAINAGYPATVQGQYDFMRDLTQVILNVPNERGIGFFYWEPTWLPVEGAYWGTETGKEYIGDTGILSNPWDNLTLFDFNGNALDSIDLLAEPSPNLAENPSFEEDGAVTSSPQGWNVWLDSGTAAATVKTESGGIDGAYKLTFWSDDDYSCSVYQVLTGLENGTYALSAWIMNGGQDVCWLYAKNFGGTEKNVLLPLSDTGWTRISVEGIEVANHQCEIGIYTVAGEGDWCNADLIRFSKSGS
ncbi:MAG: glycosyl hydrolase 53 family protein [Clostridium sp.]|nr:glycosyl hydrolase 53 family protein [Clostridium sp.]